VVHPSVFLGGGAEGERGQEVHLVGFHHLAGDEALADLVRLADHAVVGDINQRAVVGLDGGAHVQPGGEQHPEIYKPGEGAQRSSGLGASASVEIQ